MTGKGFRAATLIGAAALALAFAGETRGQNQNANNQSNNNGWPHGTASHSPVLAVVGDIACQPDEDYVTGGGEAVHETCETPKPPYTTTSLWQSQEATANQIEAMKPDAVALLGDLQYQVGMYQDFKNSFDLTYGAFKFLHRPAPGNHEFYDEHSERGVAGYGYFSYYNGFQTNTDGSIPMTTIPDPCPPAQAAGCNFPGLTAAVAQPIPRADGQAGHFELGANGGQNGSGVGDGWYSYNMGGWHLVSLNIECSTQPGGCSDASGTWLSAELAWLKKDLEENRSSCTLAYWHQPSFSPADSLTPEGTAALAFWKLLYEYNADLVLNGHDHLYARYRPLDPTGKYDPRKGIREIVVGTGGETLDTVVASTAAGSDAGAIFNAANIEKSTGTFWGVMALTLDPNGYRWDYESALEQPGAPAGTFSDKGAAACHGGGPGWGGNNQ